MENEIIDSPKPRRRRVPIWLRWILGIVIFLVVVVAAAITGAMMLLTPERLTPLVEEYAPHFINGEVKVKRVEVTFWHTFPRFTLDIDSLTLISHSLDKLDQAEKKRMPQWSDTLLTVQKFNGSVNLRKIFANELEIYDVSIDGPKANIVIANDSISNFDLVAEEPADTTSSAFKSITIQHFTLNDAGPIRFLSVPDSIDAEIALSRVYLDGSGNPYYGLESGGWFKSSMLNGFNLEDVRFRFDGGMTFDFEKGLTHVGVEKLDVAAAGTELTLSADVDLADDITLNAFTIDAPKIVFDSIRPVLGPDINAQLERLQTDASAAVRFQLTKAYVVDTTFAVLPSGILDFKIFPSYVKWPQRNINISKLELTTKVTLDGQVLNNTVVEVPKFFIDGYAIDIDARALITSPLINPRVAGEIKGRLIIDKLPGLLLQQIPGSIKGTIGMDTKFRLRQSQLNAQDFHKIYANGVVSLRDFDVKIGHTHEGEDEPDSLKLYTPLTLFRFASDKKVEANGVTIDSLLSLTLTADSLYYFGEGMDVRVSKFAAGLGAKNTCQSADTTSINPFGGQITIGRLRLNSEVDSTRLNLTGVVANASLTRYEGRNKVPLLRLNLEAKRISAGTPDARVFLGTPKFVLTANMNPRREGRRRASALSDSTANDSTLLAANDTSRHRRQRPPRRHEEVTNPEDSLTEGIRNLIRRWNAKGEFTAKRARLFTPALPLNNTITDVDLYFTTDSILLKSLKMKAGESDFSITGSITGLKKSLGRRRNKEPMKIEFDMVSDTINIDELSRAVFAGAAAGRDSTLWDVSVDENTQVAQLIDTDTTATAPLLVPPELDATLNLKARNVIYTGMLLHNFNGELGAWDSAIHLHDLKAASPMGDIFVSALYNAPNVNDLEFGMGMQLLDFHIEKFLQLTPTIDELLPAIKDFAGVINADIALTTRLDPEMNFVIPSVQADVKIDGDSLVLLDADTFKTLSKWLFFKNKKHNMIDHMSVELQVDSSQIVLFPFIFNIDRYKLGVMGSNDLDMNLNYHVSVLKSPIPFKFGINITGNLDNMKIRLGGAKIKENTVVERMAINTDTRINLINQLENVFRRGANSASGNKAHVHTDRNHFNEVRENLDVPSDTLSTEQNAILEGEESPSGN